MKGDAADLGNEAAERNLALSLQAVRQAAANRMIPTGECRYCGEAVEAGRLFCGVECRDDYEREQAARRRNGTA